MIKAKKDTVATEEFVLRVVNGEVNGLRGEVNGLRGEMEERFEVVEKKAEERYNKVMENLDSIAGQFNKFDEERLILSDHSRDHGERIDVLEKAVFKTS